MELVGRQIRMIPLAVIPPPIITPSDMTVRSTSIGVAIRVAAQIIVPMTQRPVPMINFNSDLP